MIGDGCEVETLFRWTKASDEYGEIRVELWPEGLVFWVGGEIRWKSWRNKKGAELASRPAQNKVDATNVADLDAECERYVLERIGMNDIHACLPNEDLQRLYRQMISMQFWRAKAKGRPLP